MKSGEALHGFRHEAMNTWFEISFAGIAPDYARKAATEAFREIDRLETLLSRFREGSDVDVLNKKAGIEPVRVTEETWDCLLIAMDLEILTAGTFCVAFESFMDASSASVAQLTGAWIEMDPEFHTVRFKRPGITIDLGGIGKGYALDLVVRLLDDWEIESLLIHSGTSSVVARGNRDDLSGWPMSIGADAFPKEIRLVNASLSGSSLAVQDSHILDLKTQSVLETKRLAWAWADSGAVSDGLSTSFMLMPIDRIAEICQRYPALGALVIDPDFDQPYQAFGTFLEMLP